VFTILVVATEGFGTVAFAGRRASSSVPHIPQKRKVLELFSPHCGQITMVLPILLSYILTLAGDVIAIAFVHFY
jgi:hypothetical protein